MDNRTLNNRLAEIVDLYPEGQRRFESMGARRIAFHVNLALGEGAGERVIADIGGGLGLFTPACASFGARVTLVDDFRDPGNIAVAQEVFGKVHRRYGVEVVERDVIGEGVDFKPNSLDVVTIFDSMEHWHNSPKRLLHSLVQSLRPGGRLIISVPNCVNLRKRLTVPFGRGKWSPMAEWYELERFRAHVREPDVADLRYIARDLGLVSVEIVGRNWLGYTNTRAGIRAITPWVDVPLRGFPSLCANIYLIGRKP